MRIVPTAALLLASVSPCAAAGIEITPVEGRREFLEGEAAEVIFALRNPTTEPVRLLGAGPLCACLFAPVEVPKLLGPGETVTTTVRVPTNGGLGSGELGLTVGLATQKQPLIATTTVRVVPVFETNEAILVPRPGLPDSETTLTLRLPADLSPTVKSVPAGFTAAFGVAAPEADGRVRHELGLRSSAMLTARPGEAGSMVIGLAPGDRSLSIPVRISGSPDGWYLEPKEIDLGDIPADLSEPRKVTVRIMKTGGKRWTRADVSTTGYRALVPSSGDDFLWIGDATTFSASWELAPGRVPPVGEYRSFLQAQVDEKPVIIPVRGRVVAGGS